MIKKIYKNYLIWVQSLISKNKRTRENPNKNLMLFKGDKLGDFFIFIPHLQKLIELGYNITLVSASFTKEIVDHLDLKIHHIVYETNNQKDIKKVIREIQKHNYIAAINFSMNVWGGIFVNNSFSDKKIALLQEKDHYVYKGTNLFYDKCYSYDRNTKTIDSYTKIIKEIISNFNIEYSISANSSEAEYIICHPFAGWKPREWPYFKEFLEKHSEKQFKIVGTKKELDSNSDYKNFETIELKSISHLMSVIESSSAFIGNDSGPAHYAALLGKKTNVIWGPGNLDRIKPQGKNVSVIYQEIDCRPCRQKGDVCERGVNKCLIDIKINDLEKALKW